MFFIHFNGFLKPQNLRIFSQKFSSNPPLFPAKPPECPTKPRSEGRHEFDKPNCKNAVITGGTGAIGLATANQLLCSKARKVALIDLDICKGKEAVTSLNCAFGKDKAIFLKADVTNKMEIEDALRRVRGEFQKVDMIINTFGIWDEKQWEKEIYINLMGTLNINQIAKDILVRPGGFVLNVIGLPGIEVFVPSPVLAASFNGVMGYTTGAGHERNASHLGLRTVALCCGITHSNFSKDADKRHCCVQRGNDLRKYFKETCWQKPDVVGKAVIEVLKFAPSGTIWIVEGSRLFSLKLPDLVKTYRHLEHQFI